MRTSAYVLNVATLDHPRPCLQSRLQASPLHLRPRSASHPHASADTPAAALRYHARRPVALYSAADLTRDYALLAVSYLGGQPG